MVIARVQELIQRDWTVQIINIFEKEIGTADCLAHLGHSLHLGVCYYLASPSVLCSILHDDLMGTSLIKMVV